jgi:hypothetical protein
MKTLTPTQIELLTNPDVKVIAELYAKNLYSFDSFAAQFTVDPKWKILEMGKIYGDNTGKHDFIHSVQYKSETPLTVGDDTDKGKIKGFRITGNDLLVNCVVDIRVDNVWNISEVKKIERKPRFVTNGDAENVFDGDVFYWVESIDWSIQSAICTDNMQGKQIERTYFKSKEKATEFVLLNSTKLSVNEVMEELAELFEFGYFPKAKDLLINLIKSKQ